MKKSFTTIVLMLTIISNVMVAVGDDVSTSTATPTGASTARTVAAQFGDTLNVLAFGSGNNGAALSAAATAATSAGKTVLVTQPVTISTALGNISAPIRFESGGKLVFDNGGSVELSGPLTAPLSQIFSLGTAADFSGLTFSAKVEKLLPQWWGAEGDGTTDDTLAIQAAADAASERHGVLYIPAPSEFYKVTSTITLDGCSLVGESPKDPTAGIAQFQTNQAITVFVAVGSRMLIENIGVHFNLTGPAPSTAVGFQFADAGRQFCWGTVRNVYVRNAYDSYKTWSTSDGGTVWSLIFEQVHSGYHVNYGFNFNAANGSTTLYLNNCYAIGTTASGNKPKGFYFNNICQITGNAIYVDSAFNDALNINTCAVFSLRTLALESPTLDTANSTLVKGAAANVNIEQISVLGATVNVGAGNRCGAIQPAGGTYKTRVGTISMQYTTSTSGTFYKYLIGTIGIPGGLIINDPTVTASDVFANGYDVLVKRDGRYIAPSVAYLTGTWTAGNFVWNGAPVELGTAGSKYVILGWTRITTGSNNVVGTDWLQARVLTGN